MRKRFKLKNIVLPDRNVQKQQGRRVSGGGTCTGRQSVGGNYCVAAKPQCQRPPSGKGNYQGIQGMGPSGEPMRDPG